MSNTLSETIVPVDEARAADGPGAPRRHWSRWLIWILALTIALWAIDTGLSLYIRHSGLQRRFTARLAAAFGRPVTVRSYDFSFWTGPTLTAEDVTVAEDPRFGAEYFVRADSMSVGLRWLSLLRGHFAIGTLSLTHPSVNVVRAANGDWNLANWLPASPDRGGVGAATVFEWIEFTGGRVNFKEENDKLPLAFVDVEGSLESTRGGSGAAVWRIDATASPWRAAELLQHAGTIHVAGQIGGTSSRLLPAALDVSWSDASISDVLRLAQSYDAGIRGTMNLAISARTTGETWMLQGRAELRQLHRWDLAERADNPAVNLTASMKLSPLASGLELTHAVLESPGSKATIQGALIWDQPHLNGKILAQSPASAIQVVSSSIDLADVTSWMRAFDGNVASDFKLQGSAALDAEFAGWPLRLARMSVSSAGVQLTAPQLREPVNAGAVNFHYDGERVSLAPISIWLGAPGDPLAGRFDVAAEVPRRGKGFEVWRVAGSTGQVSDLVAAASELGWNLSRGWEVAGPFRCDLKWPAGEMPGESDPSGFVELGGDAKGSAVLAGASLHAPFLNLPVEDIRARADWKARDHHITVMSAQGFGAHWSGTLDHAKADSGGWQFSLEADQISASALDRWLNPRWRESFLDRMLPFFNSRNGAAAIPENLRGSGHFAVGQFVLTPLSIHRLQGDLRIEGRHIEFNDASGQMGGGQVSGAFTANLQPEPSYHLKADFADVDLSNLADDSPNFRNLFGGSASGNLALEARGADRSTLLATLECQGGAKIVNADLRRIDLIASLTAAGRQDGDSLFREASAAFSCKNRQIVFQDLLLLGANAQIDGSGSIDASHALDFRLNLLPEGNDNPNVHADRSLPGVQKYEVSGPLTALEISKPGQRPRGLR